MKFLLLIAISICCVYAQLSGFKHTGVLEPLPNEAYTNFGSNVFAKGDKVLVNTEFYEVLLYVFDTSESKWVLQQKFIPPPIPNKYTFSNAHTEFGHELCITESDKIIIGSYRAIFVYNRKDDGTYPTVPDERFRANINLDNIAVLPEDNYVFSLRQSLELFTEGVEFAQRRIVDVDETIIATAASPNGLTIAAMDRGNSFDSINAKLYMYERSTLDEEFVPIVVSADAYLEKIFNYWDLNRNKLWLTDDKLLICASDSADSGCVLFRKKTNGWDWNGEVVKQGSDSALIDGNYLVTRTYNDIDVFEFQGDGTLKLVNQGKTDGYGGYTFSNGKLFLFGGNENSVAVVGVDTMDKPDSRVKLTHPIDLPKDGKQFGISFDLNGSNLVVGNSNIKEFGVDFFNLMCDNAAEKLDTIYSDDMYHGGVGVSFREDKSFLSFQSRVSFFEKRIGVLGLTPDTALVETITGSLYQWLGDELYVARGAEVFIYNTTETSFEIVQNITFDGTVYQFEVLNDMVVGDYGESIGVFERNNGLWSQTQVIDGIKRIIDLAASQDTIVWSDNYGTLYIVERNAANQWPNKPDASIEFYPSFAYDLDLHVAVYDKLVAAAGWKSDSKDLIIRFYLKVDGEWQAVEDLEVPHGGVQKMPNLIMNKYHLVVSTEQGRFNGYGAGVVHTFGRCSGEVVSPGVRVPTSSPTTKEDDTSGGTRSSIALGFMIFRLLCVAYMTL